MKTFKRIIGIDPGVNGGLAFIDTDTGAVVLHKTENNMGEILADAFCGCDSSEAVAYLEKVGGFIAGKNLPGSMMFKLGENFGHWQGLLTAWGIRTILVRPQDWQKGISGTTGTKGAERKRALAAEAKRRFPAHKVTLANCDALLIADYGRSMERAAK